MLIEALRTTVEENRYGVFWALMSTCLSYERVEAPLRYGVCLSWNVQDPIPDLQSYMYILSDYGAFLPRASYAIYLETCDKN